MSLRELVKLAHDLQGKSAAAVDEELRRRHLDPQERLSVRLEIRAQAEQRQIRATGLATDQQLPPGTLASDLSRYSPESPPVSREMQTWLRKAALSLDRSYTEPEVDAALTQAGLDTLARMSVKAELYDRKLIRASAGRERGQTFQARSDEKPHGKLLVDAKGHPITLRGCAW